MRIAKWISLGLLALCACSMAAESRPNIILCMTDDHGWGDVGYNGLTRIKTPALDAMAAGGLRFDRFYAQQSCSPTRASVMTGRHPNRMGVFWPGMPLRREERTIAQAAQSAGYATAHFGKWHLNGIAGPGKPITVEDPLGPRHFGFDEWFSVSNYFEPDWTFSRKGERVKVTGDGSDAIVAEALEFIGRMSRQKQPFLALVWYGSPHVPHKPLPMDLEAAGGSGYYGELIGVDRSMGALRAGLRQFGIAGNTLVWFCGDNGGWLDPKRPDAFGTNLHLRGRKGDMWEGGIRVPAVMEWPAKITRPAATSVPAGVVDIYPTLLAIMGARAPQPARPLDGISLVPLIEGRMNQRPQPMGFWQYDGSKPVTERSGPAAWNDNRYKLHRLEGDKWELYDIVADPSEKSDIAAKEPQVVERMKGELGAWQQSVLKSFQGGDYPPAPATQPALPGTQPAAAGGSRPLKVFILAGQSNMDGNANVSTIDFLGEDPEHGPLLKRFKPDGKTLVTRDDVWVAHRGVYGKLAPGFGARRADDKLGNCIGPEYAFGYFMGEAMEEQVLLIKVAAGGTSLYQNWRPPSAGLPSPMPMNTLPDKTKVPMTGDDFGGMYRGIVQYTRQTLQDLKKRFPEYDEKAGYEICGLVWFQGYNDMFCPHEDYGKNLAHLISDLRKDLQAPGMRVVVGVMGVNGPRNETGRQGEVRRQQRMLNDMPELRGTVKAIETAPLLHPKVLELKANWLYEKDRDLKQKPITPEEQAMLNRATSNLGYHYFGEGRFFILLGQSFAGTMLELLKAPATPPTLLRGLEEVGQADVELRGGFWGPRLKTHHEVTIPHALDCLEKDGHVTNFDKAAGKFDGPLRGHHAFDSDLHKAMEGAMYILQHNRDDALRQRIEGILGRILAAQQKDGFLISCWIVDGLDKRWDDLRLQHQMYNAGHFFEMAIAHARMSGEARALDAAQRFADHIDSIFGPGKRYDVDGHQEVELALVRLYRATGERRYLELARFFLDERGYAHGMERKPFARSTVVMPARPQGPLTPEQRRAHFQATLRVRNGRMQDHKPVVEQLEAVGHAVRAGYMYAAMTDIVRFMDAPGYERALDHLWDDVVSRKMYLTGAVGTGQYDDEGFGDPYLLPNGSAYCESCATIAHVLWQHRMGLLKGDTRRIDVMELALYNGVLSGISISGNQFFYQNPLESKGARRSNWIGLSCCPTNLARILPQVGGLAYARSGRQIYVNLYAAGEASIFLDGGENIRLEQQTDYPWDGRVLLKVTPEMPADFGIRLRIPGWAMGRPVPGDLYRFGDTSARAVELKVNGQAIDAKPLEDGYVHMERRWQSGDAVELSLPMPIRRVYAHEKVKEDQGKVAMMRGPIVYCVEGIDHPDIDIARIALPRAGTLSAERRPALLGGVTVLQGKGSVQGQGEIALTAIPYYAWANRERCAMAVWLSEAP